MMDRLAQDENLEQIVEGHVDTALPNNGTVSNSSTMQEHM